MKNALTAKIEATRVARFQDLKPFSLAFVDSLLPDGRKRNAKVIGKGVVENPAMSPPIAEDHGFTVSWILVPPGGGAGLHSFAQDAGDLNPDQRRADCPDRRWRSGNRTAAAEQRRG